MSIIDEVGAFSQHRGSVCTVNLWLKTNPDYDTAQLREAAAAHSQIAVYRFMSSKGYAAGRTSVQRHLNGECQCP